MLFEWDEDKNRANIQRHKIDFADAPAVFGGPMLDEREDYGEQRWIGIGFLRDIVVVVVFIESRQDTIRIISARKASKHEQKRYEQALTN